MIKYVSAVRTRSPCAVTHACDSRCHTLCSIFLIPSVVSATKYHGTVGRLARGSRPTPHTPASSKAVAHLATSRSSTPHAAVLAISFRTRHGMHACSSGSRKPRRCPMEDTWWRVGTSAIALVSAAAERASPRLTTCPPDGVSTPGGYLKRRRCSRRSSRAACRVVPSPPLLAAH